MEYDVHIKISHGMVTAWQGKATVDTVDHSTIVRLIVRALKPVTKKKPEVDLSLAEQIELAEYRVNKLREKKRNEEL